MQCSRSSFMIDHVVLLFDYWIFIATFMQINAMKILKGIGRDLIIW
jgi:hypothetical protein